MRAFHYSAPHDVRGQITAELVKVFAILIGIGATPLFSSHWLPDRFWAIGLAAGSITAATGIFYAGRQGRVRRRKRQSLAAARLTLVSASQALDLKVVVHTRRHHQAKPTGLKLAAAQGAPAAGAVTATHPQAQVAEIAALPDDVPAAEAESGLDAPPATGPAELMTAADPQAWLAEIAASPELASEAPEPWVLLPAITISIGVFIMLPAVIALLMQLNHVKNPDLMAMYFSTPALLLWIAAEGVYFYPHFKTEPKRRPQVMGMLKSTLEILSALVLWVFLGLRFGGPGDYDWLFWIGTVLAIGGAGLAIEVARGHRAAVGQPVAAVASPDIAADETLDEDE